MQFDFSTGYNRISGDGGDIIGYVDIYNTTLTYSTEIAVGQGLYIGYEFQGDTPASFTLYSGATWKVAAQNETVQFGQMVQCERILPDMSQKDFLKDTLQRFGIICQTDVYTKSIIFASLKDIVNNIPVAKDWTCKCIDQGKQLSYQLGNYTQVNTMEYQTDPNILPLKFGWDQVIINNQTLSTVSSTMVSGKFGPSLNRPYYGGSIAQIKTIDSTSTSTSFTIGVQPRLLIDQKIDLRNFNNASVTGTVLPGLRSNYYAGLQKILQNTKVLVRYFLLTPRDIADLDLLIPVYLQQHNAYFYINKIDSWRKGQPCKVELVRLG
jgi:hypothetical protein